MSSVGPEATPIYEAERHLIRVVPAEGKVNFITQGPIFPLCELYRRPEPARLTEGDRVILGTSVEDAAKKRGPREIGDCIAGCILTPAERAAGVEDTLPSRGKCIVDAPGFTSAALAVAQQPCRLTQLKRTHQLVQAAIALHSY